ncbi:ubiquinol-cytochrome C chaperone [Marinicauda algicola]|uniref:Ubiquinol-cytochrome C chaperone n=1 Tax=Marinicauda algicola TaxID=2029849 RepID=A0A4V3RXV9_9PROT|nr:ubiquinol-cytochrome C chaperone family protein [Marinicauda algicola]TGY87869.1 ubiquinol-cytochrome C chaperone [Marinicauda algicola]
MFARLFRKDPVKAAGERLYDSVLAAARQPSLYGPAGAPDTVDGRFDMIVIHAVLLMRRLRAGGKTGQAASQALFDRMFDDMDAALREMGTGDLKVGRKIREMGEAFYGRAKAYDAALDAGDEAGLADILARNALDAHGEGDPAAAGRALARYMIDCDACLARQDPEQLAQGMEPPAYAPAP